MREVELELISEGPAHIYAGAGNVLVCLYRGAPTAQALRDRVPWMEKVIEKHGKLGLLVVVSEEARGALPAPAFRAESRAQAKRYPDRILFSASVIEGRGVRHSLVRTFLRGLSVVAGRSIDVRFFDDVTLAIEWAAERASPYQGPSAEEITEVLDALRRRRSRPPLVP